jgi:hypothetical protein
MSHFTNIKTRFQNLFYLEKALDKLNINHQKREEIISKSNTKFDYTDLIISQSNGSDIKFCWNGQEYQLVVDMSYWAQPYPIESFMNKIAQQYAGEVIVGESKKSGFQPVKYKKNVDGSNTLILERWNTSKI